MRLCHVRKWAVEAEVSKISIPVFLLAVSVAVLDVVAASAMQSRWLATKAAMVVGWRWRSVGAVRTGAVIVVWDGGVCIDSIQVGGGGIRGGIGGNVFVPRVRVSEQDLVCDSIGFSIARLDCISSGIAWMSHAGCC